MKTSRRSLGDLGELRACEYLERLGHTVIERNWRTSHLELDIVTLTEDGLHFVEVKSRTAPTTAPVEQNATESKMRRVVRAAQRYLTEKKVPADVELFFDLVTVEFEGEGTKIEYFPQAYIPIYKNV